MLQTETRLAPSKRRELREPEEYNFLDVQELCAFVQAEVFNCNLSYRVIAERAHVCVSTVQRMAHGDTRFPRAGTLFEILRVLGFSVVVRR